ncbi:hypothetical protein CVT24_012571 [Panaeolus cyanescens]|uniref:DDE Tnp4 domain-containing protein n=1 Tax=Panaeolus cyanescens TaxID=181874 RepID=A0A409YJW3_9AGAR|nr:hypothetical protein CVT24_012571 [Panaeolus cyanescens]
MLLQGADEEIMDTLLSLPLDDIPLDILLQDFADYANLDDDLLGSLSDSDHDDASELALEEEEDRSFDIGLDEELAGLDDMLFEMELENSPNWEVQDNESRNSESEGGDGDESGDWVDEAVIGSSHHSSRSFSRFIAESLQNLYSSRYLKSRKEGVRVSPQLPDFLSTVKHTRPDVFRQDIRISPRTFDTLVEWLENDPVFSSRGTQAQLPVDYQVAIVLYRFGHSGNASGLDKVARWAGCSKGMVVLATRRVLTAILRPSFREEMISMPTAQEKKEAKHFSAKRSKCKEWGEGWCMVDGTLVPLFARPHWYGESYFDRKSNYSMNVQIINTPDLRIIDCGYGFTGSTHDASAWEKTWIYAHHEKVFEDNEFIWADSAYPIETWVVAPYKKPDSDRPDNTFFNNHVSMIRIRSEHAIGFLKGRFQSLKALRVNIVDAKSHKYATYWILACIAVHNFALRCEKIEKAHQADVSEHHHNNASLPDPFDAFFPKSTLRLIRRRKQRHRHQLQHSLTSIRNNMQRQAPTERTGRAARIVALSAARTRREELKDILINKWCPN